MTITTPAEFKQRRQQFMQKLQPNSIAIIPSAPEYFRNGDCHFPYRQNSDFYYLTGFPEPESVAVFLPGHPEGEYWLFNLPRDPLMETWNGRRAGQTGAKEVYGADQAYPIETFKDHLFELLKNRDVLYVAFGRHPTWAPVIVESINSLRAKVRTGVSVPQSIINPEIFLHDMRLHKSQSEIETMQKAAEISIHAHLKAMQMCKPGLYEYQLQATMIETFLQQGSFSPAYYPIIASGENSCILHYNENNKKIAEKDIVLIDAGAEFENYASDITRTFPANGKFSVEQRAIYEIVLKAQLTTINEVKPGTPYTTLQETAIRVITEGLVDLHFLRGDIDALIQEKAYFPFYMHNIGHWLGLDTHDVGEYKLHNEWRKLSPGMVVTVEPGIYIAPHTPNVPEQWWGIGVRIEDDVLVTPTGCDVLSDALPKQIADIEALMHQ